MLSPAGHKGKRGWGSQFAAAHSPSSDLYWAGDATQQVECLHNLPSLTPLAIQTPTSKGLHWAGGYYSAALTLAAIPSTYLRVMTWGMPSNHRNHRKRLSHSPPKRGRDATGLAPGEGGHAGLPTGTCMQPPLHLRELTSKPPREAGQRM